MGIENPVHLAFIAIVALVVLGPKRLPELARALGHGIREFREAVSGEAEQQPVHHQAPTLASGPPVVQPAPAMQPIVQQAPAAEPIVQQPAVQPAPVVQSIEPQRVDPGESVRSGDAPDHRPL
jgi:TatA/E family protein of Tat protein translocase